MKEVYVIYVAHKKNAETNEVDERPSIESIWEDINKANKHCEELNKQFKDFHFWADWHKVREKQPINMKRNYCIFEIARPNIHSELYKVNFIYNFRDKYTPAAEMCKYKNKFKPKNKVNYYIVQCLKQEEIDIIEHFIKRNHNKDVTEIYSPILQQIIL